MSNDKPMSRTQRNRSQRPSNNYNGKKSPKKSVFKYIILGLVILLVTVGIAGFSLFMYYASQSPELSETKLKDNLSSTIFAANGDVIGELGKEKRENISPTEIPQQLKDAITSIEDKRFYKHHGIDPIRIAGALVANLKGGGGLQGGSTLTQQLIKLSYFSTTDKDKTLKRKAQEAWLAMKLERVKSKDQILTYYINKVFMANNVYGMRTASKTYYGKELKDLNLAQTALLAGMPQAPMQYDPYGKHPDATKKRRDTVLQAMYEDKKISKSEYDQAVNTPIKDGLIPLEQSSGIQKEIDNYVKQVIEEVDQRTGKNIYTDGLDVHTNLDLKAQKELYRLTNSTDEITYPDKDFQVASTIIDVNTGKVVAQIGGRNIPDDAVLGNNLAVTGNRDIGSTMKPIAAYGPAIDDLYYSTGRIIRDEPHYYKGTTPPIPVRNYDYSYRGSITLREALVDSRNIPAVKTLEEVGLENSKEFLGKLGIKMKDVHYANAISGQIPTEKLAGAYGSFANGGTYYKPYYVESVDFPDGTSQKMEPEGKKAMNDSTAYMITDVLKDVISRGTGTRAIIPNVYQAGKTGTSNYSDEDLGKVKENSNGVPDITFVGYTTDYVMAVWTGYNDYYHGIALQDQGIAANFYQMMMSYLYQSKESTDWKQPDSVIRKGNELYVKGHVSEQYKSYSSYSYSSYKKDLPETSSSSSSQDVSEDAAGSSTTETTTETQETTDDTSKPTETTDEGNSNNGGNENNGNEGTPPDNNNNGGATPNNNPPKTN